MTRGRRKPWEILEEEKKRKWETTTRCKRKIKKAPITSEKQLEETKIIPEIITDLLSNKTPFQIRFRKTLELVFYIII